jgi:drug/metabolite transporter (DMT)-like permease
MQNTTYGLRTGLPLAVGASAMFGTSGSFASSLMSAGWTPAAAVTARITTAAVLLTVPALLAARGRWDAVRRGLPLMLAFGLIAVGGCQLFYFSAVKHLSVSVALLMEYLGVVLVVAWMWLRHGKRPSGLTLTGSVLAIGGLVLVLDVFGGARVDAVGVLWGGAAAVGLAVFFVLSSHADTGVPPLVVAWGGMVVGAVLLWLLGAFGAVHLTAAWTDVEFSGHRMSWAVPVLGLAVVAGVLAYTTSIAATRLLGATVSSFVGLTEVLFAALFAWLLVSQQPTPVQAVGGLVVLGGIVLVRAGELGGPQSKGVPAVSGWAALASRTKRKRPGRPKGGAYQRAA